MIKVITVNKIKEPLSNTELFFLINTIINTFLGCCVTYLAITTITNKQHIVLFFLAYAIVTIMIPLYKDPHTPLMSAYFVTSFPFLKAVE